MNTEDRERENVRWREVVRLLQLTRDESVGNLLGAALAGRGKSIESVTKLYHFALRNFGEPTGLQASTVTRKFKEASSVFLREAGLTEQQLEKVYRPYPVASDPDFVSAIDEMNEEGLT